MPGTLIKRTQKSRSLAALIAFTMALIAGIAVLSTYGMNPASAAHGPNRAVSGGSFVGSPTLDSISGVESAASSSAKFRIYYSPNCKNAYRQYKGNKSEWWINDTFNRPKPTGSVAPGYGQGVRENAASVRVYTYTKLRVRGANRVDYVARNFSYGTQSGSRCFNFDDYKWTNKYGNPTSMRNQNIAFCSTTYNRACGDPIDMDY